MFGLKGRADGFRLLFPKEFLAPEIEEKYTKILAEKHGYYLTPIDFINESIQKVNVLGFQNATIQQQQSSRGEPTLNENRTVQNNFLYAATDYNYRNGVSPISLTDRTFNVVFRHSLGYLNYFILFENFWYQFSRDMPYDNLVQKLYIDIINERGSIYSRIALFYPLINSMDMLDLDYSQPIAQSQTFNIEFKYSNFDFEFIDIDENNHS